MKKIYKLIAAALLAGTFTACDNATTDFDGFDDLTNPPYIISKTVEMDADAFSKLISSIPNKDDYKEAIAFMQANQAFSPIAPIEELGAYYVKKEFYTGDKGSAVTLKYKYMANRGEEVSTYTGDSYTVSADDYKGVWGPKFTESFTPKKSPSYNVPKILKTKYPEAKEHDIVNVNYFYSKEEPVDVTVVGKTYLSEDFESIETGTGKVINLADWITKDLKGTSNWEGRLFNNNKYANVSSYKSGVLNDIWMITPKAAIADAANTYLSFNINARNRTTDCLTILVSENFDGNPANILAPATTWTNISSSFDLLPVVGNDNIHAAGNHALDSFGQNKNLYFAFRYEGDDSPGANPKKTTTYQIDDLKVYQGTPGIDVKEKELEYALYKYDGSVWKPFTNKQVILLQPADYTEMGEKQPTISIKNASQKLPINLRARFPYALEGDVYTVVYYTAKDKCYADEFTLTNGTWTANNFVEEREAQFVHGPKGWAFDPTILVNFKANKPAYQVVVNYVILHEALANDKLVHASKNAEYYYGFSANYANVTYRDKDRIYDPLFPDKDSAENRTKFMDERTIRGLIVYLKQLYPNSKPEIGGIKLFAKLTGLNIYTDPSNVSQPDNYCDYEFQCIGDDDWKAIRRTSQNTGKVDEYNPEQ